MEDSGWKVVGVFFGTLGAAAIIFQLNQGTVAQSFFSAVKSAFGTAFTSAQSATPTSRSSSGATKGATITQATMSANPNMHPTSKYHASV